MKHKLELIYFKMRALAEAPRLLFHYTNIEYEDLMSWDYYDKEWSEVKPNIPFKQLPMLIVDRKHEICQSMAIMTFIENLAGINITDPILNAKANAIMQSAQELFMPLNPIVNFATGEKFAKKKGSTEEKSKASKYWEIIPKDPDKFVKAYDKFMKAISDILDWRVTSLASIDMGGLGGTHSTSLKGADMNDLILIEREIQKTKAFQDFLEERGEVEIIKSYFGYYVHRFR